MTPKEKAIELMNRFRLPNGQYLDADGDPKNHYKILRADAKQCALICVDEIIAWNIEINIPEDNSYWESVKSEIEKL